MELWVDREGVLDTHTLTPLSFICDLWLRAYFSPVFSCPLPPTRAGSTADGIPGNLGTRIKGMLNAHTASDRDVMLRQIEALKTARQEAEGAKQEVGSGGGASADWLTKRGCMA